jgi:DNA-binding transcriptional LysR family regulator
MDKLSTILLFVRVAETGSFSAVASEMGTTQSAVSKKIAALESNLGFKLFSRTTRAISLTGEGASYLEQVRQPLIDLESAEASLRQGQSKVSGVLRVAASVGFGRLCLMPLLKRFMDEHPQLKIDLRLHDEFADLVEQGIDAAIRIGHLDDSGLIAKRIGYSSRRLLVHPEYLRQYALNAKLPEHPDDLVHMNCIVYTGSSFKQSWRFSGVQGRQGVSPQPLVVRVEGNIQTNSSEVIRQAVLLGMGVAYCPDWLLADEIKAGQVCEILPGWSEPPSPIWFVYPPQRKDSLKVRVLGDFLNAKLSSACGGGQ